MTEEQGHTVAAIMSLKSMKEGDVITARNIEALHFFLGDLFKKLPEPKTLIDIRFTKTGVPIVAEGAELVGAIKVYDETPEGNRTNE